MNHGRRTDGYAQVDGNWTDENPRWRNHSAEATVEIAEAIAKLMVHAAEKGELKQLLMFVFHDGHHKDVLDLAEEKSLGQPYLADRVSAARGNIAMALRFKDSPPCVSLKSGRIN